MRLLRRRERGLERALRHRERFDEINGFLSASESHNRKNVGRSVEESLVGLERTFVRAMLPRSRDDIIPLFLIESGLLLAHAPG